MWLITLLLACDSQPFLLGADEPIRVARATFFEGPLPEDPDAETPRITNASAVGGIVTAGQDSIQYSGLTTEDAYTVGVALTGVGSGYWVLPVGGPDVTENNELTFQLQAAFSRELPYGLQTVSFVAFDEAEVPGPRFDTTVCLLPEAANNNLNACSPETPPQSAVISLTWDTNVDLDLVVVAPNGKIVSAKAPSTALQEGSTPIPRETLDAEGVGRLSRDSNGGCRLDSIRRESLVFPGEPAPGTYKVYASLRAMCGRPVVHFQGEVYRRRQTEDGLWAVESTPLSHGTLLPEQADGGATLGTFLGDVELP